MMTKDDFVNFVVTLLPEHLSEDYQKADIVVEEVVKFNDKYLGLTLKRDNAEAIPCINLDAFYERYQSIKRLQLVLAEMAEIIEKEPLKIDFSIFDDYEKAKEHLMIRICNSSRNEDYLKTVAHTDVADLAITYGIAIRDKDNGYQITTVNNAMLSEWGISIIQLHEDATRNSVEKFPPLLFNLANIIPSSNITNNLLESKTDDGAPTKSPFYVLTNVDSIEGASVLFYPEMMGKAATIIGEDYTIIPSSIHEVLLISDSAEISLSELKNMIRSANDISGTVKPNEILGYEPYHYDFKEKIFETADSFATRTAKKEKLDKRIASAEEKLAEAEREGNEREVTKDEGERNNTAL